MLRIIAINLLGVASIAGLAAVALAMQRADDRICVDRVVVAEILSLNYREATIRLADGRTVDVYQATLKPGDPLCLKWSRKPS